MTVPLIYLLYFFYAFAIVWGFFCLIAIMHLLKYGFKNILTLAIVIIFIFFSAVLFSVSEFYVNSIDWEKNITILNGVFDSEENF